MKHQGPTLACAKYQISHFFDFCSCKSLCKYFFRKYYFANYLKITLAEVKFGTLCCVHSVIVQVLFCVSLSDQFRVPRHRCQLVLCTLEHTSRDSTCAVQNFILFYRQTIQALGFGEEKWNPRSAASTSRPPAIAHDVGVSRLRRRSRTMRARNLKGGWKCRRA